jgi:hypothetical protein
MVFFRLIESYKNINIYSALIAGIDVGVLTFNEYHTTPLSLAILVSQSFLMSSASCATISLMITTMTAFEFEGQKDWFGDQKATDRNITRNELTVAWLPIMLLDWSIVTFLVGLLTWYGNLEGQSRWCIVVISAHVVCLLIICILISVKMYNNLARVGGLGSEEPERQVKRKRGAH